MTASSWEHRPASKTRKLVHSVRELDSPDEALAESGGANVHVGPAIELAV